MKKLFIRALSLVLLLFVSKVNAQCGHSLQFNGSNQYVSATALSPIIYDNFTIEFWVNPSALISLPGQSTSGYDGTSGQRYAISPDWGGYTNSGAGVSVGTNGVCVIEHADNYIPSLLTWSGTLTGWNHIAVVYTAKQPALYINGVFAATGLTSPRAQVAASFTSVGGGVYGYYSGQLDELRIWNTSRTASQIFNNYNTPISLPDVDLKVYLKMEEGSGSTTADASGNSNNGTLVNNPVWVAQDIAPPTISCPSGSTVNADNGICTAIVNFAAPSISDNCPSTINGTQTFSYTGSTQTWTVPPGVSSITVDMTGAEGGQEINSYSGVLGGVPGLGGRLQAVINVNSGEVLSINVGGKGQNATLANGGAGGFNGGGNGGANPYYFSSAGGGGGGASDIRLNGVSLTNRIFVAAGGGGVGTNCGGAANGGSGGGLVGNNGTNACAGDIAGTGGTQVSGGIGGTYPGTAGQSGSFGFGGNSFSGFNPNAGGGGGGGYYGGGGGAYGGGGGGSSFTHPSATGIAHTPAYKSGNGQVVINYTQSFPYYVQTSGLASGAAFQTGTTTNTYLVTDAGGNTATCSFNVTVIDNQPPAIICPSSTTVNAGNGLCTVVVNYLAPTATDNCAGVIVSQTAGLSSGNSFGIGTTTNTFMATDASGNTASCSFNVTVVDNQLPAISCPSNTTISATTGLCAAIFNYAPPVGIDNCPGTITTQTAGLSSGASFPVGNTTNTFLATDASGNTSSCSFSITVVDNQPPSITCLANSTLNADANCQASIGDYTVNNAVNLSVTVNSGSSSTSCTDGFLGGSPEPQWDVKIGGQAYTTYPQSGICFNNAPNLQFNQLYSVGTYPSTIEVCLNAFEDDGASCIVSKSCSVELCQFFATPLPGNSLTYSLTIPNSGNASWGTVNFTLQASALLPIANDNCGAVTIVQTPPAGTLVGTGNHVVNLTATDASGNTATCSLAVNVIDITVPAITCPNAVTVGNDLNQCFASNVATGLPTVSDNCTGATYAATLTGIPVTNSTQFVLGNNTIVWTATDASGNTATCNQLVIVVDNQPPAISCPSATTVTTNNSGCTYNGTIGNANANDNCTTVTVSFSPAGPYSIGVNIVTWTATDAAGNTATCTQSVTVVKVPVTSSAIISDVKCRGSNSGAIDLTATGGTGSLSYLWNTGSTNQDITGLYAGNYTVTITDAAGCTSTASFIVVQPSGNLSISISKTNVRCGGKCTGSVAAIVSGGATPYNYLWNTGSTASSITGLCAGSYTCTVTDAAGCSKVKVCIITQNPVLNVIVAAGPLSQQATANAGGGVPAYIYQWNTAPLQYGATATGLVSGNTYKVKVTDSKGCTQTAIITMPTTKLEDNTLLHQIKITPNPTDGLVTLTNSGNENLSIKITDAMGRIIQSFQTTNQTVTNINLMNHAPGIYCIHISTESNACTFKIIKE